MPVDKDPLWMTLELSPGTAAFFGLPSRLVLPVTGETPLADADHPRASLPHIVRGLQTAVEGETEMAALPEVHRFLRRWPHYADLDRHLKRGNTSFARAVARSLLDTDPNDPPPLAALALLEAQEGNWDAAIRLLETARGVASSHAPLRLQYALSLAGGGRREEALEELDSLCRRSPVQSMARFWRHEVRRSERAALAGVLAEAMESLSSTGQGEPRRADWERLEEGFPENPEVLFSRALRSREKPQEEVDALLEQVIALDPDHEPAITTVATRRGRQGKTREALRVIDRALARDPHQPTFHATRGQILEQEGRTGEALDSYRSVFEGPLSHVPPSALLVAGPGVLRLGSAAEARRLLEDTVEARPGDPLPHQLLARFDEEVGKPVEAEHRLRQAQKECGPVPSLQYALGDLLRRQERRVEAEGLFKALARRHPRSPWGPRGLGDLMVEKQPAKALEHYMRAIELNPSLPIPGYDYLRGVSALRSGDAEEARRHLERSVAGEPGNARYWCDLGAALFYAGDVDRAVTATEHALRLRPGHPGFLHNLATYHDARFRRKPWRYPRSWWRARRLHRQVRRAGEEGWRRDLWKAPEEPAREGPPPSG